MGETDSPKGAATTQTPKGKDGQTPEETLTLTKKQWEARETKARSDATADYKRLETEFNRSQNVAQAAIARLKVIEEQQLRAEEEIVKDDPERLSALRLKRDAMKMRQETEDEKQKTEAMRAEVQTQHQETLVFHAERLAETYSVKPEYLLKYGGKSKESMEELALTYGERNPQPPGETKAKDTDVFVYSGKTKGGSAELTREDVSKMSPAEINARASEIAKIPF